MDIKYFTQGAKIHSPTFFEAFKEQYHTSDSNDWPNVKMTVEVGFYHDETDDSSDIYVDIINKMWDDPLENKKGETEHLSITFPINRNQAIYLHKFLEAYLIRPK